MKLPVLESDDEARTDNPWYADGLRFTCSQCGNCCTGGPGFVWVSESELERLAEHLKLSVKETLARYCRKIGGRVSLKEVRTSAGLHDCIFLQEQRVAGGDGVTHVKRVCGVYEVRPLQCRTWPFWHANLSSREIWEASAKRCHGMNHGRRFSAREMEALRDATEWPEDAPTS